MNTILKKALIIDDELDICMLLKSILKPIGIEAYYSTSLQDGISSLSNQEFGLLFLDNNLPDGSGLEKLKFIQQQNPGLKIIMISAYDGDVERNQACKDGAIDFIGKPFTTGMVKEKLMKHFQEL
ncbi:MAG: response regulator [Bacteroidota bacterium]|nr:response regulator [Bacteroidota bacterium]